MTGTDVLKVPIEEIATDSPAQGVAMSGTLDRRDGSGDTAALAGRDVFISYAHEDRAYFDELQTFLKPSMLSRSFRVWSDVDIAPGDDWLNEIRRAIERCCVAVVMVTAEYLASNFVRLEELQRLLEARTAGQLTFLWIALGHAHVDATPLASIQAVNDPAQPLGALERADRAWWWVEIVKKIELAAMGRPGGPSIRWPAERPASRETKRSKNKKKAAPTTPSASTAAPSMNATAKATGGATSVSINVGGGSSVTLGLEKGEP